MNIALLNSIAFGNTHSLSRTNAVSTGWSLFLWLVLGASTVLLISYIILSSHLITLQNNISRIKIEQKKLETQNTESELQLANARLEIPPEVNFAQLGLVRAKNVSYIEQPSTGLVRAFTQ